MTTQKQKNFPKQPIEITNFTENLSFALLRLLGYSLLVFSLIDYAAILIPPQLTNPNWEFQAMGQMVDHVWSILLGLIFVFLYNKGSIIKSEQISILKFLSWIGLGIGIFYLLMLPLGINNSLTIYKNINNQFLNQQGQQQEQLEQVNKKLKSTDSIQDLNNLARILNLPNDNISSQSTQDLKNKLSQHIQKLAQNSINTANAAKQAQVKSLMKNAVRINLGTVISGVCLITIWNMTRWIRIIDKNPG
ncbi:HpsJ family protein [Anabaena azotica]|uniref:HpsJ-like protein, cyanoexosortase A-associated n=1 Tax=Anabaena azotica TaxID=197653 RepID=UPI0039A438D3